MGQGSEIAEARQTRLPSGPFAPRQARAWIGWLAGHLSVEGLERARLMVSELVTNAVRHSGLAEGDPIHLCARAGSHGVRVSVCDYGNGFDPPAGGSRPPPAGSTGHRGLWIVDELSDALAIDGRQGRVSFELGTGR